MLALSPEHLSARDATLWGRNQIQTAGVPHHETLQKISVKSIRIFQELEEVEATLDQLEIQRRVSEIRMQIEQQGVPGERARQQSAQLRG